MLFYRRHPSSTKTKPNQKMLFFQIQCQYFYLIEYNSETGVYEILRTDNPNLDEYYNGSQ